MWEDLVLAVPWRWVACMGFVLLMWWAKGDTQSAPGSRSKVEPDRSASRSELHTNRRRDPDLDDALIHCADVMRNLQFHMRQAATAEAAAAAAALQGWGPIESVTSSVRVASTGRVLASATVFPEGTRNVVRVPTFFRPSMSTPSNSTASTTTPSTGPSTSNMGNATPSTSTPSTIPSTSAKRKKGVRGRSGRKRS